MSNNRLKIKIPALSEAVMISAILVEVLWAYSWLIWITLWPSLNWLHTPLSFISCAALALFSGILTRVAISREWSLKRVRWTVLPGSVLLLLLLIRLNNGGGLALWDGDWAVYASDHLSILIGAFVFGIYCCWRGISSSRQNLSFSDLYRKFMIGVAATIVLIIIWGFPKESMPGSWSKIGLYLIFFFGCGLLSLALANLETLKNELLKHQEASAAFSRRWVSILVILVIAILAISIAVMGIFSSNFVGVVLHGLGVAADWLLTGAAYLLYPVGLVAAAVYYVVQWIINWLRGGAQPPTFTLPDFSDVQRQAEGQPTANIPLAVLLLLKWGLLLLLIILLVFLLSRALVRFWQGKDLENLDEEHETFFSWALLRGDLAGFFGWLFRWMKRKKKPALPTSSTLLSGVGRGGSERDYNIRELYRALLWQGSQFGTPRKPFETALEYGRRLQNLVPTSEQELDPITQSYIKERYGEAAEEPERLALLNRLWRTLRLKLVRKA